ncbi:MAG: AbrB/MazE/SpoVT family DNA-binding domain-containing protein [Nanoarchaeota archaeon]|nr:AbrB/MazE/SpoVT family DNA-binding domain-containing protein [Nanoarchaeota archaeon]
MKRKLVKQGSATMMISLPSKWVKNLNLKKGDEINLEEEGKNLIISSEGYSTKKELQISINQNTESSIRTNIINAYRNGYDKLEIDFKDSKDYSLIVNILKNYLIGFEIIKREENKCVVENITEPSSNQFEILFRKILYNISSLIENTEERLKNKKEFKDYEEIVLKIHQYDNFCRRTVIKNNLIENQNLFWTFSTLLIHGQRELYHLNKFLDKNKINFNQFDFYNSLKKIFNLLNEAYVNKDMLKIELIHRLEKEIIYKDFYNKIQKSSKNNVILFHIALAIKNFYLASSPLIGLLRR